MTGKHTQPVHIIGTDEWWLEHIARNRRAVKLVATATITASLFGITFVIWRVFT